MVLVRKSTAHMVGVNRKSEEVLEVTIRKYNTNSLLIFSL